MTDNFIEELLLEAEQKEEQQTEAYFDLLLLQIESLQTQIKKNFNESEKEISLIRDFTLRKNLVLDEKIKFLELKLEAFIRNSGEKTISLTHGTLKFHDKQDKVEVEDLEKFLKSANTNLMTVVPESLKPNLQAIKAFIKRTGGRIPEGVKLIKGQPTFTYKLNSETNENGEQTETGAAA